jgi:hypothetical protein
MDVTCTLDKLDDQMPAWHRRFLLMLPRLRRAASFRFRTLSPSRRQDLVNDIVGTCCALYARLVEKGQEERAHFSTLVKFAAAHLGQGRQLGSRLSARDVASVYCQRRQGIRLERLDLYDETEATWKEILIEDRRHSDPASIAAARIDVAEWLGTMPALRRKLALFLARGESTAAAARRFSISAGRISQIRRELQNSWAAFHGEPVSACAAAA